MSIADKLQKNVLLSGLTTFKIGGPAKNYLEVNSKEELQEAFDWAMDSGERVVVIGGGSNLLVSSQGFDGLVIKIKNSQIKVRGDRLECGAGAVLGRAVNLSATNSLSGFEWAIGIPGTIGGAIRGNAGAYGSSMEESVETVEVFDRDKKMFEVFSRKDCEFRYRGSKFKKFHNLIIWSATLKLIQGNLQEINDVISENLRKRVSKQPRLPSAGCVFKNLFYENILAVNPMLAQEIMDNNLVKGDKFGVGWLIDKLGLKGKTIGGAKISLEHANFIVNTGNASYENVLALIDLVKKEVKANYGLELEEEVQRLN